MQPHAGTTLCRDPSRSSRAAGGQRHAQLFVAAKNVGRARRDALVIVDALDPPMETPLEHDAVGRVERLRVRWRGLVQERCQPVNIGCETQILCARCELFVRLIGPMSNPTSTPQGVNAWC